MSPIPSAMIEAAARALHEHDRVGDEPHFDGLAEADRDSYRAAVRAVLTAALDDCDIRNEGRWTRVWAGGAYTWEPRETRTVITTPWTEEAAP